jgi:hypothetical protein
LLSLTGNLGGDNSSIGGNNTEENTTCNPVWIDYGYIGIISETFNTSGNVNRIISAEVYHPRFEPIPDGDRRVAEIEFNLGLDHYLFIMYITITGVYDGPPMNSYGVEVWKNGNLITGTTDFYPNYIDPNFRSLVIFNRTSSNQIKLIPIITNPWNPEELAIYNGDSLEIYGEGDTMTVYRLDEAGGIKKCN